MIYVTGDCHGDWHRFSSKNFPEQKSMTRDDYVIICGDFGLWHDTPSERWWLDWLETKPFTLLFVDGNHENFDRLYGGEFDVIEFCGGKVHKIRENVYHLIRGHVFEFCGKKFFAFGGASSHDINDGIINESDFENRDAFENTIRRWDRENKMFRVNHVSWWGQELPSDEEMSFGIKILKEHNNKVDYILSHCCPQHVVSVFSRGFYKADKLTTYFNKIESMTEFDKWFFGHYHDDDQILGKYIMLYEQIVRVE